MTLSHYYKPPLFIKFFSGAFWTSFYPTLLVKISERSKNLKKKYIISNSGVASW